MSRGDSEKLGVARGDSEGGEWLRETARSWENLGEGDCNGVLQWAFVKGVCKTPLHNILQK